MNVFGAVEDGDAGRAEDVAGRGMGAEDAWGVGERGLSGTAVVGLVPVEGAAVGPVPVRLAGAELAALAWPAAPDSPDEPEVADAPGAPDAPEVTEVTDAPDLAEAADVTEVSVATGSEP